MDDKLMTPEEVKDALLQAIMPQLKAATTDQDEDAEEPEQEVFDFRDAAKAMWAAYTDLRKIGFSDAQAFELTKAVFTTYIE